MPPKKNAIFTERIDVPVTPLQKKYIRARAIFESVSEADLLRDMFPDADGMREWLDNFASRKRA